MQTAELFIKERNINGKPVEELWVAIMKFDGTVIKRLRYQDFGKLKQIYSIKNIILLKHLNLRMGIVYTEVLSESNQAMSRKSQGKREFEGNRLKTILVTGIVREKTFKPDISDENLHYYFQLAEKAPERWTEMFLAEIEKRIVESRTKPRYVWIEDGFIMARCKENELIITYLTDIKPVVKATNQKYVSYQKMLARFNPTEIKKARNVRLPVPG